MEELAKEIEKQWVREEESQERWCHERHMKKVFQEWKSDQLCQIWWQGKSDEEDRKVIILIQ